MSMPERKFINIKEAIQYIEELNFGLSITGETIRKWCKEKNIGVKFGGRWIVNKEKLNKQINKQLIDRG